MSRYKRNRNLKSLRRQRKYTKGSELVSIVAQKLNDPNIKPKERNMWDRLQGTITSTIDPSTKKWETVDWVQTGTDGDGNPTYRAIGEDGQPITVGRGITVGGKAGFRKGKRKVAKAFNTLIQEGEISQYTPPPKAAPEEDEGDAQFKGTYTLENPKFRELVKKSILSASSVAPDGVIYTTVTDPQGQSVQVPVSISTLDGTPITTQDQLAEVKSSSSEGKYNFMLRADEPGKKSTQVGMGQNIRGEGRAEDVITEDHVYGDKSSIKAFSKEDFAKRIGRDLEGEGGINEELYNYYKNLATDVSEGTTPSKDLDTGADLYAEGLSVGMSEAAIDAWAKKQSAEDQPMLYTGKLQDSETYFMEDPRDPNKEVKILKDNDPKSPTFGKSKIIDPTTNKVITGLKLKDDGTLEQVVTTTTDPGTTATDPGTSTDPGTTTTDPGTSTSTASRPVRSTYTVTLTDGTTKTISTKDFQAFVKRQSEYDGEGLGKTGPGRDGVDNDWGPKTTAMFQQFGNRYLQQLGTSETVGDTSTETTPTSTVIDTTTLSPNATHEITSIQDLIETMKKMGKTEFSYGGVPYKLENGVIIDEYTKLPITADKITIKVGNDPSSKGFSIRNMEGLKEHTTLNVTKDDLTGISGLISPFLITQENPDPQNADPKIIEAFNSKEYLPFVSKLKAIKEQKLLYDKAVKKSEEFLSNEESFKNQKDQVDLLKKIEVYTKDYNKLIKENPAIASELHRLIDHYASTIDEKRRGGSIRRRRYKKYEEAGTYDATDSTYYADRDAAYLDAYYKRQAELKAQAEADAKAEKKEEAPVSKYSKYTPKYETKATGTAYTGSGSWKDLVSGYDLTTAKGIRNAAETTSLLLGGVPGTHLAGTAIDIAVGLYDLQQDLTDGDGKIQWTTHAFNAATAIIGGFSGTYGKALLKGGKTLLKLGAKAKKAAKATEVLAKSLKAAEAAGDATKVAAITKNLDKAKKALKTTTAQLEAAQRAEKSAGINKGVLPSFKGLAKGAARLTGKAIHTGALGLSGYGAYEAISGEDDMTINEMLNVGLLGLSGAKGLRKKLSKGYEGLEHVAPGEAGYNRFKSLAARSQSHAQKAADISRYKRSTFMSDPTKSKFAQMRMAPKRWVQGKDPWKLSPEEAALYPDEMPKQEFDWWGSPIEAPTTTKKKSTGEASTSAAEPEVKKSTSAESEVKSEIESSGIGEESYFLAKDISLDKKGTEQDIFDFIEDGIKTGVVEGIGGVVSSSRHPNTLGGRRNWTLNMDTKSGKINPVDQDGNTVSQYVAKRNKAIEIEEELLGQVKGKSLGELTGKANPEDNITLKDSNGTEWVVLDVVDGRVQFGLKTNPKMSPLDMLLKSTVRVPETKGAATAPKKSVETSTPEKKVEAKEPIKEVLSEPAKVTRNENLDRQYEILERNLSKAKTSDPSTSGFRMTKDNRKVVKNPNPQSQESEWLIEAVPGNEKSLIPYGEFVKARNPKLVESAFVKSFSTDLRDKLDKLQLFPGKVFRPKGSKYEYITDKSGKYFARTSPTSKWVQLENSIRKGQSELRQGGRVPAYFRSGGNMRPQRNPNEPWYEHILEEYKARVYKKGGSIKKKRKYKKGDKAYENPADYTARGQSGFGKFMSKTAESVKGATGANPEVFDFLGQAAAQYALYKLGQYKTPKQIFADEAVFTPTTIDTRPQQRQIAATRRSRSVPTGSDLSMDRLNKTRAEYAGRDATLTVEQQKAASAQAADTLYKKQQATVAKGRVAAGQAQIEAEAERRKQMATDKQKLGHAVLTSWDTSRKAKRAREAREQEQLEKIGEVGLSQIATKTNAEIKRQEQEILILDQILANKRTIEELQNKQRDSYEESQYRTAMTSYNAQVAQKQEYANKTVAELSALRSTMKTEYYAYIKKANEAQQQYTQTTLMASFNPKSKANIERKTALDEAIKKGTGIAPTVSAKKGGSLSRSDKEYLMIQKHNLKRARDAEKAAKKDARERAKIRAQNKKINEEKKKRLAKTFAHMDKEARKRSSKMFRKSYVKKYG